MSGEVLGLRFQFGSRLIFFGRFSCNSTEKYLVLPRIQRDSIFAFPCHDEGGREIRDEYGLYDGMTPISAITSATGLTVAIYFTKPPTRGANPQEVHLLKLATPPADIVQVYRGRA